MNELKNFIVRNSLWLIVGLAGILIFCPGISELKTLLFIVVIESMALALSGLAHYVYTKIDFTKDNMSNTLGYIFVGVHLLTGMTVLGVYLAQ